MEAAEPGNGVRHDRVGRHACCPTLRNQGLDRQADRGTRCLLVGNKLVHFGLSKATTGLAGKCQCRCILPDSLESKAEELSITRLHQLCCTANDDPARRCTMDMFGTEEDHGTG